MVTVIPRCGAEPQRRLLMGQEPSVIAEEGERVTHTPWVQGASTLI